MPTTTVSVKCPHCGHNSTVEVQVPERVRFHPKRLRPITAEAKVNVTCSDPACGREFPVTVKVG